MTPTPASIAALAASTLGDVLAGHTECALLDYPDYGNVGDSAIWLGQLAILQQLGIRIRYVAKPRSADFRILRQRMKHGVVLINGGGNFGTIWPDQQEHRERVLAELRDYPVVQLPQSIHYDSEDAAERTRALIAAHPDFTLLVRDEASRRFATEKLGARTVVCPDSAFFLADQLVRNAPAVDLFVLARTDKERSASADLLQALNESGIPYEIGDWLDDPMTASRWLGRRVLRLTSRRFTQSLDLFPLLGSLWEAAAWQRMHRGTRLLSRGRVVVTDRLHAHILCVMLGIPHVVLDNNYGKIQSFVAAWTEGSPLVRKASTPQQAVAEALALLRQDGDAPR